LALLAWEAVRVSGVIAEEFMPSLATIGESLRDFVASRIFWNQLLTTVVRTLLGLAIAAGVGFALAILAGRYARVRRMLAPTSDFLRAIPPPALIPLCIFVVGISPSLYVIIIAFGCIWPLYINASNALAAPEPVQMHTARSFGLSDWEAMWLIRIPAALPETMTGVRLSASIALLSAVAMEMLLGSGGLGALIFNAGFSLLWGDMYALMIVIGILGLLLDMGVRLLRWMVAGWQMQFSATGESV
jgi:ABC-type nitrate/sulfonate/bicarbonate transport system permease component